VWKAVKDEKKSVKVLLIIEFHPDQ